MENLSFYNHARVVPIEAQKTITGGRLNGFTDINPMWRIKILTEKFGMCGFGWYYDILEEKVIQGADGEQMAFVKIALYIKQDEWSKPIIGLGGSSFTSKEKAGLRNSDECFKMALTDAIGVACKSLGIGADVYFAKDRTKYDPAPAPQKEAPKKLFTKTDQTLVDCCIDLLLGSNLNGKNTKLQKWTLADFEKSMNITAEDYSWLTNKAGL